jgi:hypothetical protein
MESKELPANQSLTISRRFCLDFWENLLVVADWDWDRASRLAGRLFAWLGTREPGLIRDLSGGRFFSMFEISPSEEISCPQTPPNFLSTFRSLGVWQSRIPWTFVVDCGHPRCCCQRLQAVYVHTNLNYNIVPSTLSQMSTSHTLKLAMIPPHRRAVSSLTTTMS